MRVVHANHRSPAFTLIELLVVLAIIAILAALSFVGYVAIFGRAYERNTNAGIEHIYGVLKKQWNHVVAEAKKESIPDSIKQAAAPDSGQDTNSAERARVMLIMLRLAEAFPQSYAEVKSPAILKYGIGAKYSATYYAKWLPWGKIGGTPANESAACLLMALTTSKGGASINLDMLPTKPFDIDGDTLPELCDSWQQPLAFFRFPYANAKLVTKAPSLTNQKGDAYTNPFDPMMTLTNWNSVGNKKTFEDRVMFEVGGGYFAPTVVSSGKDNFNNQPLFGLRFANARGFPDMAILPLLGGGDVNGDNILDAADNLYSFDIVAP